MVRGAPGPILDPDLTVVAQVGRDDEQLGAGRLRSTPQGRARLHPGLGRVSGYIALLEREARAS
ncbi:hypothetical protein [Streptosporangium sp. NPDC049644]|uniref:hypothetical protein n=1 Tax=Streptosporangium sp. NPDC049644 TaxID=3155507 RepID=UPI003441F0AF